eukprot:gene15963-18977_t
MSDYVDQEALLPSFQPGNKKNGVYHKGILLKEEDFTNEEKELVDIYLVDRPYMNSKQQSIHRLKIFGTFTVVTLLVLLIPIFTVSIFTLRLILAYIKNEYIATGLGTLFYIAFVKDNVDLWGNDGLQDQCANGDAKHGVWGGCVSDLQFQIFSILLVNFISGLGIEVIFPLIQVRLNKYKDARTQKRSSLACEEQYYLPSFDTFDEYNEIVLQFALISMFAGALPFSPLIALLHNFVENKTDAYKLCYTHRRPSYVGSKGIGHWYKYLVVIGLFSVITNVLLVGFSFPTLLNFTDSHYTILWIVVGVEHAVLLAKWIICELIPDETFRLRRKMAATDFVKTCILEKHLADRGTTVNRTLVIESRPQEVQDAETNSSLGAIKSLGHNLSEVGGKVLRARNDQCAKKTLVHSQLGAVAMSHSTASSVQVPVNPQSTTTCTVCVDFFDSYLVDVIKIVTEYGVVESCSKICGMLNKTAETDICKGICDVVGVDKFWRIFTDDNINPMYACQLLKACEIVLNPAASFDTVTISPSTGYAGDTFLVEANFTVVNDTGVGQFAYVLYLMATASRYEYYQTFVGYPPGTYSVPFVIETTANATFPVGEYPLQL